MRQPDSSPLPADLLDAARAYFPDLATVEVVAGHPDIARVTTPAGPRLVRRWPKAASATDVAFSHEIMAAAHAAGLPGVPGVIPPPEAATEPGIRLVGSLYTAREWLPGAPPKRAETTWPGEDDRIDLPVALPPALFAQIIGAVASLHEATAAIAARRDVPAAPLSMLPGAVRQAHGRHLGALRARARREPAIQRWLAAGERLLAGAEPMVVAASHDRALPTAALHLGLWPSHILLADDSLFGLLGWERVAIGSPLLDIAQATLRLQGWSDETVEAALGAYGEQRRLSPDERRLLPAVAALDAVATTGRLLEQTYGNDETARPPTVLRSAIDLMLRSLTALERDLTAQATVGKSRRAPWRHAPRPAPRRKGGESRERRR
jgi:aminoglycoside phosphotransferase (APT) family kinase protein